MATIFPLVSEILKPKSEEVRSAATMWWYWWVRCMSGLDSDIEMEMELYPGPRLDRDGDPYRTNIWGKSRCGMHYHNPRLICLMEERFPGSLQQFYSPFWPLLDSADPWAFWAAEMPTHFRGETAEAIHNFLKDPECGWEIAELAFEKHCGADALCLLAGLGMHFRRQGDRSEVIAIIRKMLSILFHYYSIIPNGRHLQAIFDLCRSKLWNDPSLDQDFAAYNFSIACQFDMFFRVSKVWANPAFTWRPAKWHGDEVWTLVYPHKRWNSLVRPADRPYVIGAWPRRNHYDLCCSAIVAGEPLAFPELRGRRFQIEYTQDYIEAFCASRHMWVPPVPASPRVALITELPPQ